MERYYNNPSTFRKAVSLKCYRKATITAMVIP
jgi:hypothetical protein